MSRAKVRYRCHLPDVVSYLDPGRRSSTSCGLVLGVGCQYLAGKHMCYDRDVFCGVVLGFQCTWLMVSSWDGMLVLVVP